MYDEFGDDAAKLGWDEKKADQFRAYRNGSFGGRRSGGMPFDFEGAEGQGFDFESILGEMFGTQRKGPRARARAGADFETSISVTLREAVTGCERTLSVNGRRLTVQIPAGVDNGSKIRLQGQGAPGDRGGPPGDLFVTTTVGDHPLVRRIGGDLYLDVPITIAEAALGGEIAVPTFGGGGKVTIRPGTQSGTKLRLKGKGVPNLKGSGAGDLYLVLHVKLPEVIDESALQAIETLRRSYQGDLRADLKL